MGIHINGEPPQDVQLIRNIIEEKIGGKTNEERENFMKDTAPIADAVLGIAQSSGIVANVETAMAAAWVLGATLYLFKHKVLTYSEDTPIPDIFEDAFGDDEKENKIDEDHES